MAALRKAAWSRASWFRQSYAVSMTTNKKNELLKIVLANGNVKEFSIEPEPPINPERIPVTEAHKRGVFDPMTGSLVRVPGTGDPVSPEACTQGTAVFDGRMRYDLKLEYKRIETIKVDKGYQGPVVVCADHVRADRGLRAGSRGDQIPESPAQYGSVVCADPRHARADALQGDDPDAGGDRGVAGDAVHQLDLVQSRGGSNPMT